MIVIPVAGRVTIVESMKAADGFLDGVLIQCYKNDIAPGVNSKLSDFVPSDFPGYAAKPEVVWGGVFIDATMSAVCVGTVQEQICTGPPTESQFCYGYAAHVGTDLRFAERFDVPIPMAGAGDAVVILPRFAFGQ